ncbi:hypothetical protein RJ639_037486 [Escallonia herrerae]|uniref:Uncharacterized protein n=1 Tax=Escallonia herrerae TaxID=1293975 RepID=A0AA88WLA4_9ASTE|nr:hypothetical protein RJ639_037486 [Escallonia herrerae]
MDGVDIMSLSIGLGPAQYFNDPVAIVGFYNSKGKRSRREFDSLSLRLIRPAMVLTVLDDSLPGYNDNTSEIGALQIADPANQNKDTELLFWTQERDNKNCRK